MKNGPVKTIIVLGMHRSGTSMIAGVLSGLGVSMGGSRLEQNRVPGNPLGHYEDRGFVELNTRILNRAGGDWQEPPDREAILSERKSFENRIKRLLEKLNQPLSGWKDPRTSLTIELYLPQLKNPFFLVCHRQAESVAGSLARRNKIPFKRGIELHGIYEERICNFFHLHPDLSRLDLEYKEVTKNPERSIREIISFLRIKPEREMVKKAVGFILPNQLTHRMAAELRQRLQKRLRKRGPFTS